MHAHLTYTHHACIHNMHAYTKAHKDIHAHIPKNTYVCLQIWDLISLSNTTKRTQKNMVDMVGHADGVTNIKVSFM